MSSMGIAVYQVRAESGAWEVGVKTAEYSRESGAIAAVEKAEGRDSGGNERWRILVVVAPDGTCI